MEKPQNWQQALKLLPTLSEQPDEILRQYIQTVTQSKFWPLNTSPDQRQYIGYQGDDTALMVRLFRIYAEQFDPGFAMDATNQKAVEYLATIAAGKAQRRGLVLRGPVGTGKTLLILLWTKFRQDVLTTKRIDKTYQKEIAAKFYLYTSSELIKTFTEEGNSRFSFLEYKHGDILILDDIGVNTEGNYFGAKTNVLAEIIYNRYSQFKKDPEMEIYATTNLTSPQLTDIIGERSFSRLVEMAEWNAGSIAGSDRRRIADPVKVWPTIQKERFYNQRLIL